MPVDIEALIARSAITLLTEHPSKKLTVKDIVEKCRITRQTFYYHFEDIPDLLRWTLSRGTEQTIRSCLAQKDMESGLRYFFVVALNIKSVTEQGLRSGYREEIEQLMYEQLFHFLELASEEFSISCAGSYTQQKLLLRYHSLAILGLLHNWKLSDTRQMDELIHNLTLILSGQLKLSFPNNPAPLLSLPDYSSDDPLTKKAKV